jgi:alkyl hydroperoxide reductase subunit AhpC
MNHFSGQCPPPYACRARVGERAPPFEMDCVDVSGAVQRMRLDDFAGSWLILIFYPRDFSFVCPTELTSFSARLSDFQRRECRLLGISVDSAQTHASWLALPEKDGGLGKLQFPLASDPSGEVSRAFGVWVSRKEVAGRGLFIIDPQGVLQYSVQHNLSVGRHPDEVLRVLDALRAGGLCPASWTSADGVINVDEALTPGRVIGHYKLRRRLANGAFASVFEAQDLRLDRPVALKVLRGKAAEARRTVLEEARAAAALNHPHICTIHAVEEEDGLPLIVMEYLDGRPLTELLDTPTMLEQAPALAGQLARGLAAAHVRNVVHGDLKPANILVLADGSPKILDFGLARSYRANEHESDEPEEEVSPDDETKPLAPFALEAANQMPVGDADLDATVDFRKVAGESSDGSAGGISGTPRYMSPEQARGEVLTPASDVFSLGLILYEMATGRRAVREKSVVRLVFKLQGDELGRSLVQQAPAPLQGLLSQMLAREPGERPTMDDVAASLLG